MPRQSISRRSKGFCFTQLENSKRCCWFDLGLRKVYVYNGTASVYISKCSACKICSHKLWIKSEHYELSWSYENHIVHYTYSIFEIHSIIYLCFHHNQISLDRKNKYCSPDVECKYTFVGEITSDATVFASRGDPRLGLVWQQTVKGFRQIPCLLRCLRTEIYIVVIHYQHTTTTYDTTHTRQDTWTKTKSTKRRGKKNRART